MRSLICRTSLKCRHDATQFICGELLLYGDTGVEHWAIIHHLIISHGPTAVCIREPQQRLKMIRFITSQPTLSLNRTASRKKGFCPLSLNKMLWSPSGKCFDRVIIWVGQPAAKILRASKSNTVSQFTSAEGFLAIPHWGPKSYQVPIWNS